MSKNYSTTARGLLQGILLATTASLALSSASWAGGDIKAGEAASKTCAGCHGAHGNSSVPTFPSLAGQPAKYLAEQLHAFRDGSRKNAIMNGQAKGLSDQQIADLAAYYAAQTRAVKPASNQDSVAGAHLYRFGRGQAGIAACAACHGPHGRGNHPAGFPQLRGLSPTYVKGALEGYRSGARHTDQDKIMRRIAGKLTDKDIAALAQHIGTLH